MKERTSISVSFLIALLVMLSTTPAGAAVGNVIENPSFEQGSAGWTTQVTRGGACADFFIDDGVAKSGQRSASIRATEGCVAKWNLLYSPPAGTLKRGQTWRLEVAAKTEFTSSSAPAWANDGAYVRFTSHASGWSEVNQVSIKPVGTEDGWTIFRGEVTLPQDEPATITVELFIYDSTGQIWFDDVSLSLVEDAAEEDVPITVSNAHPGGNIRLNDIRGSHVVVEQELRDTTEWWFYWNMAARNESDAKQDVVFSFANGNVVGPWGPAISTDGLTWEWLGERAARTPTSFRYTFEPGEKVYFAHYFAYQVANLESFIASHGENPALRRTILTESEQGRRVDLLILGNENADEHIVLTARSHASEAAASYTLEGVLTYLLSPEGAPLLERYLIHVVPMLDVDGVENGDQGKSRAPHDHNRDYRADPIYRSTAALMEYARSLEGAVVVYIDFHNPGPGEDRPYFVLQDGPVRDETIRLAELLKEVTNAAQGSNVIRYDLSRNLDPWESWNNPTDPRGSKFFADLGARVSTTLEVPYFGTADAPVTTESLRRFGEHVARALEAYLLGD